MAADRKHIEWILLDGITATDAPPSTTLQIGGTEILVCREEGRFYAVENLCPHMEKPLDKSRIRGGVLTCPFHGAQFELASGKVLRGPAVSCLPSYPVRIVGEKIYVALAVTEPTGVRHYGLLSGVSPSRQD